MKPSSPQHRFYVVLIWFAILASARAQERIDVTDASLEDLMKVKISTASKYVQPASDAPAFVTVVSRDQIERFGYRTLADVLRSVGSFYVTNDRNYSYLGVRSFGRPGDYNTKILLLVNGHRLNDAVYDDALIGNEFPLDMDLVERIEVIRGPGSSLYGTNAFFAVVNVITRTPETGLSAFEGSLEGLAFGGVKSRVTYSQQVHGFGIMVSASGYHSDGQTLFFPEFQSPATNNGITRDSDYESYYNTFFNISRGRWQLEGLYASRDKGIPTASWESEFNNPGNHTVDNRGYLDLSYTRDLGKWTIKARGGYDAYYYAGTYINPPSPTDRIVDHDYCRSDTVSGELQIGRRVAQKHFLTLGTELRDNLRVNQGNYYVNPYTVWTDQLSSSYVLAGYIQDEYSISRSLLANIGFRIDHYSTFGSTVNPRLALIWKLGQKTNIKAIYGSAFRAPNSYELYYTSGFIQPNPQLEPESIHSVEAIVEHGLSKTLACQRVAIPKQHLEPHHGVR